MEMVFLPDTPIMSAAEDEKGLGFSPFVDLIARSLRNTEAPFVYGVLGDWGSGKTSILRLLQEKLRVAAGDSSKRPSERTFVPIWFNAWKYENEANIIYPLLHAIKRQYEADVKEAARQKFLKQFGQVVATSIWTLGDIGLRAATHYLTGQAIKVEDLEKNLETIQAYTRNLFEAALADWANKVDELERVFRLLLKSYAEDYAQERAIAPETIRFVILVDDLDRCLPETTIAILEGIKNYLAVGAAEPGAEDDDINRAVFVLALNAGVVYQGIKAKYSQLEIDGRAYLEKILNYSFYVPEPAQERVKAFATARLEDLLVVAPDRADMESYLDDFGTAMAECAFNNPRKIKRILNRYLLLISEYPKEVKTKAFSPPNLARLIVLAEYYPALFQLLYGSDEPKDIVKAIKASTRYTELSKSHDLTIPTSYPPLFTLQPLFELITLSLPQELEAVFGITRMI